MGGIFPRVELSVGGGAGGEERGPEAESPGHQDFCAF